MLQAANEDVNRSGVWYGRQMLPTVRISTNYRNIFEREDFNAPRASLSLFSLNAFISFSTFANGGREIFKNFRKYLQMYIIFQKKLSTVAQSIWVRTVG